MQPFGRDQVELEAALDLIVGRDRVDVLRFLNCPTRGVRSRRGGRRGRYRAPARGTPVLLVTDLGAGSGLSGAPGATEPEWLLFCDIVRRADCAMVAFVPFPANRVSPALRRAVNIVMWDRPTAAGAVRTTVGSAREAIYE